MLERIDHNFGKFLPLYVLATVGLGLLLDDLGATCKSGVAPLLATQMFLIALSMRFPFIIRALRKLRYLLLWSILAWLLMPGISFLLGKLFLADYPGFAAGLILIVTLPAAITGNFWTLHTQGNLALSMSIVGTASILGGFVMPPLLKIMVGTLMEDVNGWKLFINFFWTVMIPTILGITINELFSQKLDPYRTITSFFNKFLILCILFINAATIKPELTKYGMVSFRVLFLVVMQMILMYLFIIKGLPMVYRGITKEDLTAFAFTAAMRNHSAGVVIALANFGPLVAMPVIISILVQQPIASVVSSYLIRSSSINRSKVGSL